MIRERIKNLDVEGVLNVGHSLTVAGKSIDLGSIGGGSSVVGGKMSITGSGQIPTGLTSIISVSVSLGQDASLGANAVSATWSGSTITAKVTSPTSANDATPVPATVATIINWQATGS